MVYENQTQTREYIWNFLEEIPRTVIEVPLPIIQGARAIYQQARPCTWWDPIKVVGSFGLYMWQGVEVLDKLSAPTHVKAAIGGLVVAGQLAIGGGLASLLKPIRVDHTDSG